MTSELVSRSIPTSASPPLGVLDVASIAVVGLAARVKDPLPDRRPALFWRLSRCVVRVDKCFLVLCVTIAPRSGLFVYAGCGALGMLHRRLLNEGLCLAAQVACFTRQWFGHGSEQRCHCDELLYRPGRRVRVVVLKSVMMHLRACLPNSHERSPHTCWMLNLHPAPSTQQAEQASLTREQIPKRASQFFLKINKR
jgi:hypothetical protein